MSIFFQWLTKWAGYFWCGFTLLAFGAVRMNPEKFGWFSMLASAMLWLLLGNVFLLFLWRKRWLILLPIGCLVMGWEFISAFVGLNFGGSSPVQKSEIRVVSWNIGGLWFWKEQPERIKNRKDDFFEFLKKTARPDIFCTQEMGGEFLKEIAAETGLLHFSNLKGNGTAIFSRFPIEKTGEIPFEKTGNSSVWADVKLENGQILRVICVHLQSNQVSDDADHLAETGKIREKETWFEIGSVLRKVKNSTQKRVGQARRVADFMAKTTGPIVLCGDFNDTPQSYVFQLLSEKMTDPFPKLASGLGTTYRGSIPALRIDHILTDRRLSVFDYETLKPALADHNPVICRLGF